MDSRVAKIIREWKYEAGLRTNDIIQVGEPVSGKVLKICTSKPSFMIGKDGALMNKYKEKLKRILPDLETIQFIETDSFYIQ